MENILVLCRKNILDLVNIDLDLGLSCNNLYYEDKDILKFEVGEGFNLSIDNINYLRLRMVDWAIIPKMCFSDIKLVVSDMDSTFIDIECIDEVSNCLGLKDEVSLITELSMKGKIDFVESLRRRCLLLRGISVDDLQYVYDNILRVSLGVEEFLGDCQRHGIKFILISGGFTFFTDKLGHRYNLDGTFGNELEVKNGILTGKIVGNIIDANSKRDILLRYQEELNIKKEEIIAIGDGANDIYMLQGAGFSVAYHAKSRLKEYANIHIDFGNFDVIRYFFD